MPKIWKYINTFLLILIFGIWNFLPIAYGNGTNFNILLESDFKHACPVCWSQETATMVKVYKIDHRIEYDGVGGKPQ